MSSSALRTIKPHSLAPKNILDRRKLPVKKSTPSPPIQPATSFRRTLPSPRTLKAVPVSSSTTYLTLHDFPSMRPARLCPYPSSFLLSPMRRDILHKAIVYEANLVRGTGGHTKTRGEVRGSTKKIRPQKGTGMARQGSIRAPGRRKGGIVFGPRRRSFKTKLQRRVYDLAFRTAISYRYAKGQLILSHPMFLEHHKTKYLFSLLRKLQWTKKAGGGTLFITGKERKNLVLAARSLGADVTVKRVKDITVRDLLLRGRVVFERRAFEWLLQRRGLDKPPVPQKDPIKDYERLMKLL